MRWPLVLLVTMSAVAAPPPSIDDPLRTGAQRSADAAVVIGLEDYAFVADVPYAGRDADAFATFLVYTRGIPADRVRVLKSASRNIMAREVGAAADSVRPGGVLWVYFAGHGAASSTDGARLLLADDVRQDPTAFEDAGLSVAELTAIAEARKVPSVMVLDACYAGLGRDGTPLVEGKRFVVPTGPEAPRPSTWLWTAASGNELSGSLDAVQHGAFTYFAIGALRGWADGEIDGRPDASVTLDEAQAYVSRALRTAQVRSQTPELAVPTSMAKFEAVSGAGLEAPPAELLGGGSAGPAPSSDATLAQLEELRRRQQERERRVAAGVARVRAEASSTWAASAAVIAAGGPEAEVAIRQFIVRYEAATTEVDGASVAVTVPEVAEARSALARLADHAVANAVASPTHLVRFEAGSFTMGSPLSEPGRQVDERQQTMAVRAFSIASTEVTQFLYETVMQAAPSECATAGCGPRLPVQNVSFLDALAFCNALSASEGLEPAYEIRKRTATWNREANGYRLPTEAEWEYAARSGGRGTWGRDDDPARVCSGGNVAGGQAATSAPWVSLLKFPCQDQWAGLAPVGSLAPSSTGLYDMVGNVSEWVFDAYAEVAEASPEALVREGKARVFRGGSFNSIPRQTRTAFRYGISPESASYERGFRLARNAGD